jgi:PAS domain S-box-containing protein
LAASDVIGRHAFTLFPFLVGTGEDKFFLEALAGRSADSLERPYTVPATGRQGFFEGRYRPVKDGEGVVVGGFAVIRDVTASRVLKEREESLKLYFRVLESMKEGVSVSDQDGVIIYTNPAEDAMFGYEPGELHGQHVTVQNAYPPEENARRVSAVIETLKRDGLWVGEWLNRRKDGTAFVSRAQITAFESGGKKLWVCVQEDITRERADERALRQSAEHLALALEAAQLGSWQWDAATDMVSFSERAAAIFGIEPGPQMTWTRMRDLLHPDDRDRARLAVEAAVAERGNYDIEYRVNRPTGGQCWVSARGRATYSADGTALSMLGVVHDITARKAAEQALVEETRAIETISRIGQVLAAELDLQKLLQALTDAATEISDAQFGSFFYKVNDERGESYMLYTLSGARREDFARFPMPRNTAIFGPTFRGEGVIRLDDVQRDPRYGKSPPYHGMPPGHLPVRSYLAVPVSSRTGEILGGLFFGHAQPGIFTQRHERLVTGLAAQAAIALDNARLYQQAREAEQRARERANELVEADRRKDDFLAVLAHELRNPLGAISNALEVMGRSSADDARFRRAREAAVRQVVQQRRLIDDLLDVSRIARGKIELQLAVLDLRNLVHQAVADHQLGLENAGLRLEVDLPADPVHVRGDAARLTQVVGNLLDNARKFTPRGGTVSVRLLREGTMAMLAVRDTGVGVDPEVLPKLFTPFAQAQRTLARSQNGLGLGLALVKGLLGLHGGHVEAFSARPGLGTEFIVRLDVMPGPEREPEVETLESKSAVTTGFRVLIIEDIPDVAETLSALLALSGCEPRIVTSGQSGLAAAREFRPDVILCDLGLPGGMSGHEAARHLRRDPANAETSLIALTGYGAEEDQRRSREAGFDLHLTKPVQPQHLLAAIAACAKRRRRISIPQG